MTRSSIESLFGALNAANARYLVAGGLAVVAHGLVRFTADVDLFVGPPFDFEQAYARSYRAEIASGLSVTFVGLDDLLRMKRAAGRPRDLEDVAGLESLARGSTSGDE